MNNKILDKYGITFTIIKKDTKKAIVEQKKISNISFLVSGFFVFMKPYHLLKEIIPEMDKAIQGLTYDDTPWGGDAGIYLEIGSINSVLSSHNLSVSKENIPTKDLKEIMLAWIEWVTKNNLEDFIF